MTESDLSDGLMDFEEEEPEPSDEGDMSEPMDSGGLSDDGLDLDMPMDENIMDDDIGGDDDFSDIEFEDLEPDEN